MEKRENNLEYIYILPKVTYFIYQNIIFNIRRGANILQ